MSDPSKPQDFVNTIQGILKRVTNLEGRGSGQNLTFSYFADDTEVERTPIVAAQFGDLGDGSFGIDIANINDTAFHVDNVNGLTAPVVAVPMYKLEKFDIVDDNADHPYFATYTPIRMSYKGFEFRGRFDTAPGVTGNVWLSDNFGTSAVWPLPANTSSFPHFRWLHGGSIGLNNQIFVHIQRTAGTLDIDVWEPRVASWIAPDTCTVSGIVP